MEPLEIPWITPVGGQRHIPPQDIHMTHIQTQAGRKDAVYDTKNDVALFAILEHTYGHPACFLIHTNAYTLLVAVILSAQATDQSVNAIMPALAQAADHPLAMIQLGIEGLIPHIQTIGLYRRKAAYIIQTSHMLLQNHGGQVPDTLCALVQLAGVGRKTANVVLNIIFDQPTIPVDTHVFRVAKRLGLTTGTTPEAVEAQLEQRISCPHTKRWIHAWLISHGRAICGARRPLCAACPLAHLCPSCREG